MNVFELIGASFAIFIGVIVLINIVLIVSAIIYDKLGYKGEKP